jgi:hypothetical protein
MVFHYYYYIDTVHVQVQELHNISDFPDKILIPAVLPPSRATLDNYSPKRLGSAALITVEVPMPLMRC